MLINTNPKLKKFGMDIYSWQEKRLVSQYILKHKNKYYHLKYNKGYYLYSVDVKLDVNHLTVEELDVIYEDVESFVIAKYFQYILGY